MIDEQNFQSDEEVVRTIRDLVLFIAKALVDEPERVEVSVISDGRSITLRLIVAPSDIGRIIGKEGRTARSIRTMIGAASMKSHQRFALDIA